MQQGILDAIRQTASVPSMPLVATRFIELCAREDQEYDDLVDLLSTDAGMASEVLRLANSPLFGVSRKIGTLKQAMTLLGLSKIRSLIISRYLIQQLDELPCPSLNQSHFWQRSVTCAALASRFCEQVDRNIQEEAFISGLLADVGVIVLAGALPEMYAPIARDYEPLHSDHWVAREQHTVGISHAEVSALVLQDWKLPEMIVDAVRFHHDNIRSTPDMPKGRQIACVVAAASKTAQLFWQAPDPGKTRNLCSRVMEMTGLEMDDVVSALLHIEEDLADLAGLLGMKIGPLKAYDIISQRLAAELATDIISG